MSQSKPTRYVHNHYLLVALTLAAAAITYSVLIPGLVLLRWEAMFTSVLLLTPLCFAILKEYRNTKYPVIKIESRCVTIRRTFRSDIIFDLDRVTIQYGNDDFVVKTQDGQQEFYYWKTASNYRWWDALMGVLQEAEEK
jgi:hypothetical protein